jgi:hypothetical protein
LLLQSKLESSCLTKIFRPSKKKQFKTLTPGLVVIGVDVGQVVGRVTLFRDVVVTDVALAVNAVSLKVSL